MFCWATTTRWWNKAVWGRLRLIPRLIGEQRVGAAEIAVVIKSLGCWTPAARAANTSCGAFRQKVFDNAESQ